MSTPYSALDPEADRGVIRVDFGGGPWAKPKPPAAALKISLAAVMDAYGVTEDEVTGYSRHARIARARQAWYALIEELAGQSRSEIGRMLGRNHATISWGIRATADRIETDRESRQLYWQARRLCRLEHSAS